MSEKSTYGIFSLLASSYSAGHRFSATDVGENLSSKEFLSRFFMAAITLFW